MRTRQVLALSANDFKNIFRDRTLTMLLVIPVVFVLVLRLGVPLLGRAFPVVVPYYPLILGFFCTTSVVFPAFVVSFIMLDEKDEDLLKVMRVMPVSALGFVAYRLAFVVVAAMAFSLVTIGLNGLVPVSPARTLALAVLLAGLAPVVLLTVVTFAGNKIEGLALVKGLNLALMLPLVSFFTESPWRQVLGIVPVYWTYHAFGTLPGGGRFGAYVGAGLLVHLLFTGVLYRWFRKKVF